ncbi:hypothetical protein LIN46_20095, partial [Bacillus thuringiensis]|uniref:hypothetical protein n=1 Tax=Bacillus thuringiensis TaxID=1428 RepID=UPI001D192A6A
IALAGVSGGRGFVKTSRSLMPTTFVPHPKKLGGHFTYIGGFCTTKKSSAIQQSKRKIYNPIKIIQIIDTFKRRNLNFHHNNTYV